MKRHFLFYQVQPPDARPELFFDDQPVESLIYHTEIAGQPSPADIITWQLLHDLIWDVLPQQVN